MEREEKIKFWLESSRNDFDRSERMYKDKDFAYALFFGQLSLEKLFKALFLKRNDSAPPAVHNLIYLAGRCGLEIDKYKEEDLREISKFNINARYDDYKLTFHLKATKKFTDIYMRKIKEVKKWLEKELG